MAGETKLHSSIYSNFEALVVNMWSGIVMEKN